MLYKNILLISAIVTLGSLSTSVSGQPALLAGAVALDALPLPKAADLPGLTVAQSLRIDGPGARAALGFPASAPAILREAERGNAFAMAVISTAYSAGSGVAQSDAEARRWAIAAAQSGLPFANYVLALVYNLDQPNNYAEAERLFGLASDAGQVPAKGQLAVFLMAHRDPYKNEYFSVRTDDPRQLLDEAAAGGDKWSIKSREILRLNDRFAELVRGGMPLTFQRAIRYVHESKSTMPCLTDVFTTNHTGVFRIDWRKSTTEWSGATAVAIKGAVFTLWNGQGYVGFRLMLAESNDTYTADETVSLFRSISDVGRSLGQICSTS
jgi:hypothetical protein